MSVTILGTDSIEITPDPVSENSPEIIPRSHIAGMYPLPYQEKVEGDDNWDYPYPTRTVLVFQVVDGRKLTLELQTVSNHPGWSDGTMSALTNAKEAVLDWLEGTGGLAPNPAINVNPSSLTAFGDTDALAFSAAKTFQVSGSNLTANLVVTAPTGFIINQDGSTTNASPITFIPVSGTVTPKTIHVRFNPQVVQDYTTSISCTSTGAATQNVGVSGTIADPEITISQTSFSFPDTEVLDLSASQSYSVTAKNLTGNLVITAPPGFIINEDDSDNDDGPITLVPNGAGSASSPTGIFCKFAPTDGQSYSGNITNVSAGATTKNVAVDGEGLVTFIHATGGTVSTSGNRKIHTFNSDSTFTVTHVPTGEYVEALVVAGGGGGGGAAAASSKTGGGGGGGGVVRQSNVTVTVQGYSVTVGAGGAGGANSSGSDGTNGSDSSFNSITATGGGGGGGGVTSGAPKAGKNGGSGGGAGFGSSGGAGAGGTGTAGQGFNGGAISTSGATGSRGSGGGGGGYKGMIAGNEANDSGYGGVGRTSKISGADVAYGSGGKGHSGGAATANSGNGGNGLLDSAGTDGAAGVVIISYPYQHLT